MTTAVVVVVMVEQEEANRGKERGREVVERDRSFQEGDGKDGEQRERSEKRTERGGKGQRWRVMEGEGWRGRRGTEEAKGHKD